MGRCRVERIWGWRNGSGWPGSRPKGSPCGGSGGRSGGGLGRAASTVSRELRRSALPKGGYLPVHAEGCYRERRQRQAVLERDERLARVVGARPRGGGAA